MRLFVVLLAFFVLTAARPVALTGVTVIDGTGAPPRPGMSVILEGERIADVFPDGDRPLPAGAERTDLTGRFLIPGLVSAHEHMMQRGLGESPERAHAELRRLLYAGVTTIRDMAGDARLLRPLRDALRDGDVEGPDLHYSALMAGPDFIAADPRVGRASAGMERGTAPWMQVVSRETDADAAVERAVATGASAIKVYVGVEADVIARIVRAAHARGLLVFAHTAVFPDRPIEVVGAGVDSVSHLCWAAWQDADLDPASNVPYTHILPPEPRPSFEPARVEPDSPEMTALFAEMARRRIVFDVTLSAYRGGPGAERGCTPALMSALARAAAAAGVPLATGTDWFTPDADPFPSVIVEIETLVERGVLTPLGAIEAATRNGARLLRLEDEQGTIASGMLANLVVLRENPAADIGALRSVETVIKRGRFYPRAEYEAGAAAASDR